MPRSLLLHGARLPLGPGAQRKSSLLIRHGRIDAVGDFEELKSAQAESIDLSGCLLLPGFHDTHTHFFEWARRLAGVDLSVARTHADLRSALLAHREQVDDSEHWVGGSGWDPGSFRGDARLDRALLDEIFPDRPVALESRDFHTLWCNTAALRAAGVLAGQDAPQGGEIGRREDGSPDGLLHETAWDLIWKARPLEPLSLRMEWTRHALERAHAVGLTGFHSMELDSSLHTYQALRDAGQLHMRVCFHSPLSSLEQRISDAIPSYEPTDPWIRMGGVKIFMDGSLGSRTACMRHPYPDGSFGRLLRSSDELSEILVRAGGAGIAGSIHAIGDVTLEAVLDAVELAGQRLGPAASELFHRVEHAQCVWPEQLGRMARLGLYCAVQPVHLADDVPLLPVEWPMAAAHAYPLRSLVDAGVELGLGSDAPVASIDPRLGIYAAMERRAGNRPDGEAWCPEQALDQSEALLGYSSWAARAGRWEEELGSLLPGMRADLVALDDPGGHGASFWLDARVRMTMVDGQLLYEDLSP